MKQLVKITLIFVCCYITTTTMAGMVGGITNDEKAPDEEVQAIVTSLGSEIKTAALEASAETNNGVSRQELEEHFKTAKITALGHKTQVVAGTTAAFIPLLSLNSLLFIVLGLNYFVRTKIGDYIFHARIYHNFQGQSSLSKVIGPKRESDPIKYF